jgi:hypothetical protein
MPHDQPDGSPDEKDGFILTYELERIAKESLPAPLGPFVANALEHVRRGCFQRSLCFVVASTSVIAGAEVAYEHYKGSYSNPVMYTPVILSGALAATGTMGVFSKKMAQGPMRWVSVITLADGIIGFFFHVRGIARKPAGWSMPVVNIVMGPPLFAPLLFGTSAYLGVMASYLRREEEMQGGSEDETNSDIEAERNSWKEDLKFGRFQKHLAAVTIPWALCSGAEALYSHYKNNFRYKRPQWSPIILTPVLMASAFAAIKSRRMANTLLPAASLVTMADGAAGFVYHARGIVRRPGGLKKPAYNMIYGPPIFAPLLFAACGFLGMMASLLRRERS